MVLRGKPVGEQGAADRWTALAPLRGRVEGGARAPPFFLHPPPSAGGRGGDIVMRWHSGGLELSKPLFSYAYDVTPYLRAC